MKDFTPLSVLFADLAKSYLGVLSERLEKKTGINRYFYALLVIGEANGLLSQQQLTELLNTDKVSMVRIVDYLCRKGMVKRQNCDADRRAYLLVLTPKAQKVLPEIRKAYVEIEECLLEGVDAKKRKEFRECLSLIQCNMNKLPITKMNITITQATKKSK